MTQAWPVITIDGPSGTGKGTVSQLLATKLRWHWLDSGVLYRALGLAAMRHAIDFANEAALADLARRLNVQFVGSDIGEAAQILLEGEDVSEAIRSVEASAAASKVGVYATVREALLARQRAFCQAPGLVTDGRDMGTVIFPQAQLKIYLDASPEARAQRRYKQLKEKGINVSLASVLQETKKRDVRDQQRKVAPLKPAADAIIIDTTDLTIDEVFQRVLQAAQQRFEFENVN